MNEDYESFYINFSTQFLAILMKTILSVKKKILKQEEQDVKESFNAKDLIEYKEEKLKQALHENVKQVSPYIVRNETG